MSLLNKKMNYTKKIKYHFEERNRHWVGNGFYVHGLLRPNSDLNKYISPFILLDYASPKKFTPSTSKRGVGEHPHRGFETVTFAFQGEIEHRDSSGGGGIIKPGDVQWMTAAKGVVHDEFHSKDFSKEGGVFEMVQLWVNLPKKYKMSNPKYQGIPSEKIPKVKLGNSSNLRIIAGDYEGKRGPASTFTKIHMYDIFGEKKDRFNLSFEEGTNTILLVMKGSLKIENKLFDEKNILIFEREGENLSFDVSDNFRALILNGEPIDEPIFAHGPFVMNTREEILEAIEDYQNGKMGYL